VNASIRQQLLELNHQFYQTFALQFSATRHRLQPGVRRIIERLPLKARLLDLGCGNGELAAALAGRSQRGRYVGLDFSPELLEIARRRFQASAGEDTADRGFETIFLGRDLAASDWEAGLPEGAYDTILAFAVLHHLPGAKLRLELLRQVRRRLRPGGQFIHSEWQFVNSPRLVARIQPWEAAGLNPRDLEPGDTLLDWRSGGQGLRYVHAFTEAELEDLAAGSDFSIRESFYSDGEGGRLSLYQAWQAA
jgi:SAM-dependent methyltransferase